MQFSLFESHSLFISFAVYFLASHHALGLPVHRKRKQKSQDEAERWSLVVPYFIIYVYSSSIIFHLGCQWIEIEKAKEREWAWKTLNCMTCRAQKLHELLSTEIAWPAGHRNCMICRARKLHELPGTEIANSATIRLASALHRNCKFGTNRIALGLT